MQVSSAHIEEGYLQAERGELINSAQARLEIQEMKDDWRLLKPMSGYVLTPLANLDIFDIWLH